jgi:hypothetical protein
MWRAVRAVGMAIRQMLGWRARQLRESWRDLRRLYREGPPTEAQRRALARFWFHGGWDAVATLATAADGTPRCIRLVVQPDGDVLLWLPRDFGNVADDCVQAGGFLSDANRQLAAMRRSLSVNWGALGSLGSEIIGVLAGAGGALHGVFTAERLPAMIWLVGSVFVPTVGCFAAKRLVAVLSRIALCANEDETSAHQEFRFYLGESLTRRV